jgi:hypothetical protein
VGKKSKRASKKQNIVDSGQKGKEESNLFNWLETHKKDVLLLVFIVYVLSGIVHFSTELSTIGDNAQFIILGQSLAEGKGYKPINLPTPTGHTKYPFGFPALLALFYPLFHLNYLGYKIVVFLFSIATFYFLFKWLNSYPVYLLFSFLFLMALNLKYLEYSSLILSETPFLFFLVLGFYYFRQFDKSAKTYHFIIGILSWGIAYYMRTIGIVLFPALFLYLLFRKEYKWVIATILLTIVIITPWQLWTNMHGGISYLKALQMKNPYSPHLGKTSFSEIITQRIPLNFKGYFFSFIPETLFTVFKTQKFMFRDLLGALLTLSVIAGFLFDFWKKWDLKGWYFLGTMGVVLLWPEVWMGERFLFGIIPLILFYFIYFFYRIIKKSSRSEKMQSQLFLGVTAVLLVLLLIMQFDFTNPQTQYSPDWINYKQAMIWLKHNASPDEVICCRKPYLGYLWSGKKTIGVPAILDQNEMYKIFNSSGVTYLLYDGFYWSSTARRYLGPIIQKNQSDFTIVYALDNPPTYVLKFKPTMQGKE